MHGTDPTRPSLRDMAADVAAAGRPAFASDGPVRIPVYVPTLPDEDDGTAASCPRWPEPTPPGQPGGLQALARDVAARGQLGLRPRPAEAALAELDAEIDARVAGIPVTVGDVTVVHREPISRKQARHLAAVVGGALAVASAVLGVTPGGAPVAQAAVLPVTRPIVVTVSGPSARVDATMVSTSAMTADGGHGVVLQAGRVFLQGTGGKSRGPALVRVVGQVASSLLTPGTTPARVVDIGDGVGATAPFTVLRQSRVTITSVTGVAGGVRVTGTSAHYDIPTRAYRGDLLSTVLVQRWTGATWVTVTTAATTGPEGAVAAVVPAPAGIVYVRLVRPVGATVTGAPSAWRTAVALPTAATPGTTPSGEGW